jgi:phosphate transport system substrate-binding protein
MFGRGGTRPNPPPPTPPEKAAPDKPPTPPPDKGRDKAPGATPEPKPGSPAPPWWRTGAGSSLIAPMMDTWTEAYRAKTKQAFAYHKIGSVKGERALADKEVGFACTDAYLDGTRLAEVERGGAVVHIPLAMSAVVATYNLKEVPLDRPLKLTGEVLAGIYLGKITRWNDAKFKISNPSVDLPDLAITVVRRGDLSGTTAIWTDYLNRASLEWGKAVSPPVGATVTWPGPTLAVRSNDGVAAEVKKTRGAIGYVELGFARSNGLPAAKVKGTTDEWVEPSLDSVTAATAALLRADWYRLTDETFAALQGRKVPEAVLSKLRHLRNLSLVREEFKRELGVALDAAPGKDALEAAILDAAKAEFPPDLRFTLTDAKGRGVYPICSTTWAVLYEKQPGVDRRELVKFLRWAVGPDGQAEVPKMHYAPLPDGLRPKIEDAF